MRARLGRDETRSADYGVKTKALIQALKRNRKRFPADFMFQLSREEAANLKSQSVISSSGHGGRRSPPFAFTEQGVAMLSSVLRSERAIQVNIEIMRAFVILRRAAISHAELSARIDELEERYDESLREIFETLRELLDPPAPRKKPRIGFGGPEAE